MSEPVEKTNLAGEAVGFLTSAYRTKPNIVGFLKSIVASVQTLEGALSDALTMRTLAGASVFTLPTTNAVLDQLGRLIGQSRQGLDDADFKAVLYLRAAINRKTGRTTDWSGFAAILLRTASGPVSYYEAAAGAGQAFFFGVWGMTLNPIVVALALNDARPGGVRGVFGYTTWPDGNDFEWCDVNNPSTTGQGTWGDTVAGLVGGLLISEASIQ